MYPKDKDFNALNQKVACHWKYPTPGYDEHLIKQKARGLMSQLTTANFVKYLGSMLTDFHETSTTGLLLMRQLK